MMNNKVEIVEMVLNQADLMGLMEDMFEDYNEHEYLPEAQQIAEYIDLENPNMLELARYIRQIFVIYFETVVEMDICELISDCILKNLED